MNKLLKQGLITVVVLAIILAAHYLGWLKPVESGLVRLIGPTQGRIYSLANGTKSFYASWLAKRDLLAENQRLRESLAQYQINKSFLDSLMEENRVLKEELNFVTERQLKYLGAEIITGVSDSLSQAVIINRGSRDGVAKGLAVVAEGGVLVGKVAQVFEDFSKVLLLSDNQSKVAAAVQNSDYTAGLVEGQFGLSFSMTNIPQNQEIKGGDLVVTSGLEGSIPKNLLVAKVERVESVESEIFKTAILTPIVSLNNLSDVLVIIP